LVRFEIATDITKNIEYEQTLKQNEIKLQEINSAKDKFFSIIGHDLKNPFAVLKSSSALLFRYLEKNDIPKIKAKAEMISRASKNGYALLENLLAWAKSQSGGLKFEPQTLILKNNVDKIITETDGQASEKNITIINEIPDDLILVADENLLSAVFRNLISNAIKFTHKGGAINILAQIDNNNIEIAVIDTGIGIPKEHQYKLFRLDTNFSREGTEHEPSTSLGLVLCKEFIEKHKGKIWVKSDSGKGSEFRFTLPNIQ
jgi:signal transduction histidine kinase